jgi:hydrogenase expression/formation protein HypD
MPGMIFTTFGDAMRVPGSKESLLQAKAKGADVRMVYSPLDSLRIAKENPDRPVVFFALGFETTMPSTAFTVLRAKKEGIANFSLFCNHITIIPTIKAILDSPDLHLDGFLGPGHVSMVIGDTSYRFIAEHYKKPLVSNHSTSCTAFGWCLNRSPKAARRSRTSTNASFPAPAIPRHSTRSARSSS